MMPTNKSTGSSRILLLRPFWHSAVTADYIRKIYSYTHHFGKLIVIQNGDEQHYVSPEKLDRDKDKNNVDTNIQKLNIEFIKATDDTWQKKIINQIEKSDVIIMHLAPRSKPDEKEFPEKGPRVITPDNMTLNNLFNINVQETGTGQGLLRELDFCRQANVLSKTIVLIPQVFYDRIQETSWIRELGTYLPGIKFTTSNTGEVTSMPFTSMPFTSMADYSLDNLRNVHEVISYRNFGGVFFGGQVLLSIETCLKKAHPKPHKIVTGIPKKPVALPPDYSLKNIRFTPIERLTKLPNGEIVELSLQEAQRLSKDRSDDPNCPYCGKDPKYILWYQRGLKPDLSNSGYVMMICQYCGEKDW